MSQRSVIWLSSVLTFTAILIVFSVFDENFRRLGDGVFGIIVLAIAFVSVSALSHVFIRRNLDKNGEWKGSASRRKKT
jgi:uncharacterized RDD family membrane protein YckC